MGLRTGSSQGRSGPGRGAGGTVGKHQTVPERVPGRGAGGTVGKHQTVPSGPSGPRAVLQSPSGLLARRAQEEDDEV